MLGKIIFLIIGLVIGFSLCDAFAEEYHIGIVIEKSCLISNQLDNNQCVGYDDIEKIYPDTKIKSQVMPDFSKYSFEQQVKIREQISNFKRGCIMNNMCNYLDIKKGQDIIIWHNPEAKLYQHMDIITIRSQMKVTSIYDVAQKTINELSDELKILQNNVGEKRSSWRANFNNVISSEKNIDQSFDMLQKHSSTISNLEIAISQKETWANYEKADPKYSEERQEELKGLREQYENEIKLKNERIIILADIKNSTQSLKENNKELQKEIRELNIKIQANKNKMKPKQTINQTSTEREIIYNVNQIYIDITCKKSFFAVNNLGVELEALINFMFMNCEDRDLLSPFSLTQTETIPKYQLDITTSPNWQYQQELKAIMIKCKARC